MAAYALRTALRSGAAAQNAAGHWGYGVGAAALRFHARCANAVAMTRREKPEGHAARRLGIAGGVFRRTVSESAEMPETPSVSKPRNSPEKGLGKGFCRMGEALWQPMGPLSVSQKGPLLGVLVPYAMRRRRCAEQEKAKTAEKHREREQRRSVQPVFLRFISAGPKWGAEIRSFLFEEGPQNRAFSATGRAIPDKDGTIGSNPIISSSG